MTSVVNSNKKQLFNGNKLWFIFAVISAVVAAALAFGIMKVVTATESYYVLNREVPARVQITPDMLTEVVVSAGSTPPNALFLGDLTGEEYTQYPMAAGDILTSSALGNQQALFAGLPDDYVIASFTADPSRAAGGKVERGDYIDLIAIVPSENAEGGTSGNEARYVLHRALVVDATLNLDQFEAEPSEGGTTDPATGSTSGGTPSEEEQIRTGIPTLFTVGLSPDDAAQLALASEFELFVVISSEAAQNGEVQDIAPIHLLGGGEALTSVRDAGAGTDSTFGLGGDSAEVPAGGETEAPSAPSEAPSAPVEEPSSPENTNDGS